MTSKRPLPTSSWWWGRRGRRGFRRGRRRGQPAAGKLVKGRKRLVLTDTLGHVLASRVLPADAVDGPAAIASWDEVATWHDLLGHVHVIFVDSSFYGVFREHTAQRYGIRVEKPAHVLVKKTSG